MESEEDASVRGHHVISLEHAQETDTDHLSVKFIRMCDVRLEGDSNPCWITGVATTEGRLILVDRSNFNVKLFTRIFRNISYLLIHDHPADICNFKEHELGDNCI